MNEKIKKIMAAVEERRTRSAWDRGVKAYALELVDFLDEIEEGGYIDVDRLTDGAYLGNMLLNGAENWREYSWGASGVSLVYNYDIAQRLCTPSELKRTHNGYRNPNKCEDWLDVQARALYQAFMIVRRAAKEA